MWPKIKLVGGVVLALLTLIVVLQNTEEVETSILFVSVKMPRAALLFGTLAVGFMLGVLAAGRILYSKKREVAT